MSVVWLGRCLWGVCHGAKLWGSSLPAQVGFFFKKKILSSLVYSGPQTVPRLGGPVLVHSKKEAPVVLDGLRLYTLL